MEIRASCAQCKTKNCKEGKDCFNNANAMKEFYKNPVIAKLHSAATKIEGKYYCKEPRLNEIILFAKELEFKKLGLAFCIGLSSEAEMIENILSKHFEVLSICCKLCGINKKDFKLCQIDENRIEYMCNPAGQAEMLNQANSDLNIICGLCVGHDAIFSKLSEAPVTTFIAKDRILAHNPAGAIYCQYIKRKF